MRSKSPISHAAGPLAFLFLFSMACHGRSPTPFVGAAWRRLLLACGLLTAPLGALSLRPDVSLQCYLSLLADVVIEKLPLGAA